MALFKSRKQANSPHPEEIREYYQAERRERAGMAWLLAIGTLLLTFLIAAGLFFGGRLAYRALFDNDNKPSTGQQQTASSDNEALQDVPTKADQGAPTGTSSTNTTTPSPSVSNTPVVTPNTGPDELVNTGPGDEE